MESNNEIQAHADSICQGFKQAHADSICQGFTRRATLQGSRCTSPRKVSVT